MTDTFEQYLDNRPLREKVQDAYIERIVDGMDWSDLVQMAYETFDEQMNELTDEQLYEDVKQYYPDLLENV
jgi:hypothetical protein